MTFFFFGLRVFLKKKTDYSEFQLCQKNIKPLGALGHFFQIRTKITS